MPRGVRADGTKAPRPTPGKLMEHEEISDEEFERLERVASMPTPGRKTWDSVVAHELKDDVAVRFPAASVGQAKSIAFAIQKAAKKLHIQVRALVVKDPPQVIAKRMPLMPEPSPPPDTRPVVPSTVRPSVVPPVPDPISPLDACGYKEPETGIACLRASMHGGNHRFFVAP